MILKSKFILNHSLRKISNQFWIKDLILVTILEKH